MVWRLRAAAFASLCIYKCRDIFNARVLWLTLYSWCRRVTHVHPSPLASAARAFHFACVSDRDAPRFISRRRRRCLRGCAGRTTGEQWRSPRALYIYIHLWYGILQKQYRKQKDRVTVYILATNRDRDSQGLNIYRAPFRITATRDISSTSWWASSFCGTSIKCARGSGAACLCVQQAIAHGNAERARTDHRYLLGLARTNLKSLNSERIYFFHGLRVYIKARTRFTNIASVILYRYI